MCVCIYIYIYIYISGTTVAQWLRCCATNRKVAGSIRASVSGFFIDIKSFRSHYGPGVDSASNRNEYQEYFLGVKSGLCVRLTTYHYPVPLSRNLGTLTSWNPLGLSRPVMGLLYLYIYIFVHRNSYTYSVKVPKLWPAYQQSQVRFFQPVCTTVTALKPLYLFIRILFLLGLLYFIVIKIPNPYSP